MSTLAPDGRLARQPAGRGDRLVLPRPVARPWSGRGSGRGSARRPGGRPLRATLAGLGPAVVAAIAYVDPGNVATNVAAGSRKGFELVWVVVAANLVAVLVQNLSAKLGVATGRSLPELCRERLPRPVTVLLWAQAELVTVATDLAEVVGGAVALNLLVGLPLVQGALVTAVVAFGLLALQSRGAGRFELVVAGLFAVVLGGFLVDVVSARPDAVGVAAGLVPHLDGGDDVLLAAGILGATVMPHVVYLHSSMTAEPMTAGPRPAAEVRRRLSGHRRSIAIALGLAGVVNLSMLVFAGALFSGSGHPVDTLEAAHAGLARYLAPSAALLFALALLASGLASTGVGTYAGQVIMSGFLRRRVPVALRRAAGLVPAVALLAAGADPTRALVMSQVVLSFGIPFALVPLLHLTSRRELMGPLVNRRVTTLAGAGCSALVIGLNVVLIGRGF